MKRTEAINRLKKHTGALRRFGATSLYLFGSTARDKARRNSDVDLFVDYDPKRFTVMELVGIKLFLEEELGVPVDVTTRDSLHPRLRTDIEHAAVRIF